MANFRYEFEPRRDFLFIDIKSNYASIECVLRGLHPLKTALCVMSRADNSNGLILAASPTFKKVFGMSNVGHSKELPFYPESRKFHYKNWYKRPESYDLFGKKIEPDPNYVAYIEYWAKRTHIVPPQMNLYIQKNIEINQIYANFTSPDEIHAYSIDEGFLDITESMDFFYPDIKDKKIQIDRIAKDIQLAVHKQTGLYCTVGMSNCNPVLAKLAMDNYAKKAQNMRALINYEDVEEMIWTIEPLTDFWGIGNKTAQKLNKLGIHSIRDLANANPDLIKREMGVIGLQNYFHANGIDETDIHEKYVRKSTTFSNSQVLPRDYVYQAESEIVIDEMAEQLAVRLRKANKVASEFSLGVGFSENDPRPSIRLTRKINPTNKTALIQKEMREMFRSKYNGGALRHIGVSAGKMVDAPFEVLSLFDEIDDKKKSRQEKEEKIQEAKDNIRKKYGYTMIQKGTVLANGSRAIARSKLVGGHSAGGLEGLNEWQSIEPIATTQPSGNTETEECRSGTPLPPQNLPQPTGITERT